MVSSVERYKADINRLVEEGTQLVIGMRRKVNEHADLAEGKSKKSDSKKDLDPTFDYEPWFSECLALVTQLIPDRVEDFKLWYKPKNNRKELDNGNYTISDYLRGLSRSNYAGDEIVGPSAALMPMLQQVNMVRGLRDRFESSLFDIKTLVHADLLDDELDVADLLNKNGFHRGAGAVAGVVLEAHLAAVAERHRLSVKKKNPTIADLNDLLKSASIVEMSTWRFIQHLADVRNQCDHKKSVEPTRDEVADLVAGVRKVTKTLF